MIINSRIALSLASIAAAGSLVAGATFAFFSDSGTSSSNLFSAGTVDLLLSDDDQTNLENVTATFGSANMAPGDCTTGTLNIKNNGTIAANHVDISITNSNDAMDDYLRIDTLTYDAVNQLPSLTDGQPNTLKDLDDLENDPAANLALTDLGVNHPLVMGVCLDESAPDSLQGASNDMTMTVLLDQGPH
ncbi:MAG: TasA family protein [Patescibacteria group bacterium]